MKIRTTKKAILQAYPIIIQFPNGYQDDLFKLREPIAYIIRPEGWACDVYALRYDVALCVGYDSFGTIRTSYDVAYDFDMRAREICKNTIDYHETKKQLDILIDELLKVMEV